MAFPIVTIPFSATQLSQEEIRARFDAAVQSRWPEGPPRGEWAPIHAVMKEWADIRGNNDSVEFREGLYDIVQALDARWSAALPLSIDRLRETRNMTWLHVEALKMIWSLTVKRLPKVSFLDVLLAARKT